MKFIYFPLILLVLLLIGCREEIQLNQQAGAYEIERYEQHAYIGEEIQNTITREEPGYIILFNDGSDSDNRATVHLDTSLKQSIALQKFSGIFGFYYNDEYSASHWYIGPDDNRQLILYNARDNGLGVVYYEVEFSLIGHGKKKQEWIFYSLMDTAGAYTKEVFYMRKQ